MSCPREEESTSNPRAGHMGRYCTDANLCRLEGEGRKTKVRSLLHRRFRGAQTILVPNHDSHQLIRPSSLGKPATNRFEIFASKVHFDSSKRETQIQATSSFGGTCELCCYLSRWKNEHHRERADLAGALNCKTGLHLEVILL